MDILLALFLLILAFIVLFLVWTALARLFTNNRYGGQIFKAIWQIEKVVLETSDFDEATKKVVNIILDQLGYLKLGYEVIVLTLLDQEKDVLRRIAISQTEAAEKFLKATPVPFKEILIPLTATENLSIRAIKERKMFATTKVSDVLYPALSREWVQEFQQKLRIRTSLVYPILAKDKVLGALIFSLSKEKGKITEGEWSILDSFVGAVGIALDNALLFRSLKDTTEKLRQANEKLKELDKLKDEFVSVASHELRTPMTAIKSYLWMALAGRGGELTEKQKYYLDRSYASTDRLIKLVNDMLNVSRIESGRITLEMQAVKMDKLADDVISEVTPRAQELGIAVSRQPIKDLPEVLADPDKIKEVLMNLIGNSLKFTPKGGEIKITLAAKNGMVETSVTDTGRGIAKEDLAKLFKKFGLIEGTYVTTQQDGGTGLGLYISKSIVELHGGKIWVESKGIGKGATFTFSLPVFKKRDLAKVKKEQKGKEPVGLIHTVV